MEEKIVANVVEQAVEAGVEAAKKAPKGSGPWGWIIAGGTLTAAAGYAIYEKVRYSKNGDVEKKTHRDRLEEKRIKDLEKRGYIVVKSDKSAEQKQEDKTEKPNDKK